MLSFVFVPTHGSINSFSNVYMHRPPVGVGCFLIAGGFVEEDKKPLND